MFLKKSLQELNSFPREFLGKGKNEEFCTKPRHHQCLIKPTVFPHQLLGTGTSYSSRNLRGKDE